MSWAASATSNGQGGNLIAILVAYGLALWLLGFWVATIGALVIMCSAIGWMARDRQRRYGEALAEELRNPKPPRYTTPGLSCPHCDGENK